MYNKLCFKIIHINIHHLKWTTYIVHFNILTPQENSEKKLRIVAKLKK